MDVSFNNLEHRLTFPWLALRTVHPVIVLIVLGAIATIYVPNVQAEPPPQKNGGLSPPSVINHPFVSEVVPIFETGV